MKKRLQGETPHGWRNFHVDAVHAAEVAALIMTLAAGLSVDAIACRLLRVLDDDPSPL
jgi:hypothetical protein